MAERLTIRTIEQGANPQFPYYAGDRLGPLLEKFRRRQDILPETIERMDKFFASLIHPELQISEVIQAEYGTLGKNEKLPLFLAPQIGVPDMHMITIHATIKALQAMGFPIDVGLISQMVEDKWFQDPDGVKDSYVNPSIIHTNGSVRPKPVKISSDPNGKLLNGIHIVDHGPYSDLVRGSYINGEQIPGVQDEYVMPGFAACLPDYCKYLLRQAGITTPTVDKGKLDRILLAYAVANENTGRFKRKQLKTPIVKLSNNGDKYTFEELWSEKHQVVAELINQGAVDEAVKLLEDVRPSAQLYYGTMPWFFMPFMNGVLYESYEVSETFRKLVESGICKCTNGVSMDGTTVPGTGLTPLIVQEPWISGFSGEGSTFTLTLNGLTTNYTDEITSVSIPQFIFDPTMRQQYHDRVLEIISEEYGNSIMDVSISEVHRRVIEVTIQFMFDISNSHK